MLSPNLEQTLRRALAYANDRRHDYATLEHLLLALGGRPGRDRRHAGLQRRCRAPAPRPQRLCRQPARQHRRNPPRRSQADRRLPARAAARRHPRAILRPRGGDGRQYPGRPVLRAREPRRVLPAGAGDVAARRGQLHQPRHRQGAGPLRGAPRARRRPGSRGQWRGEDRQRCARGLLRQPQPEGQGRPHRPADRARAGGQPHHPGAVPPHQEQSALCRRSRRRQDRHRRRPGAPHRQRGRAGRAEERHHLRARHGRAAGRHALSRRFRGALEGGGEGAGGDGRRHPVHRRDPHRDRRRRHLRRLDGCIEPAEARPAVGPAALHRLHHLQGIPAVFREGPRPGPPLPEDRRQRAVGRGCGEDPARPQAVLREASLGALHPGGDPRLGRAGGALHQRPQAARQGDRRDRRGRRGADAAAGIQAQEDHHGEGRRGDGRHHRPHPTQVGQQGRQGDA